MAQDLRIGISSSLPESTFGAKRRGSQASEEMHRQSSDMAGAAIDRLADQSAPPEVRAKRKRRLLKGPSEFREMREDHPKEEADPRDGQPRERK